MNLTLVVEPAAEEDVFIGYHWYEERLVGLGSAHSAEWLATMVG